ncbi:MAG: GFA family protein [Rhodospirillaceae bacterium]|jgi:adenylate cyclase|nr:GFA family protein [Rhodospirillaceae bacterium]MBT6203336.1 GFA family protein [Rhodospirillaceae bacterium]MBT6510704.1 GFA family protein [Rhodospirillaceae bacterium]MBT7648735.1 GFA family protein [Rhodospirillaceae bacterium]
MTETRHAGGCMCGAIRYEADRDPRFSALCHCHMCQQWSGSAMLGTAAFDRDAVVFTAGEPKVFWSSDVCERGFCGDCGSSLFTRYSSGGAFDVVLFVGLGTLDDPEIAPPDVHYGAEGELSWMRRDDGLTRICIDVIDPAEQNALFEKMLATSTDHVASKPAATGETS